MLYSDLTLLIIHQNGIWKVKKTPFQPSPEVSMVSFVQFRLNKSPERGSGYFHTKIPRK